MVPQQADLVGSTLGQYQILDELGRGGMAIVYKAWQPSLRRYVALKVLLPYLIDDHEFVQRFQQEAIVAANLNHTNIVTIYEVGQQEGRIFITMEYVDGRSLEQLVLDEGGIPLDRTVRILQQVADALDYAHQRRFVHRDIKPANILLTSENHVVITDFGIAKALEGSGATARLTTSGAILGTPAYMSPEQIQGQAVDYRTDLYSFGIVAYEMLSGQVPFDGTTTALLYAQVNNPPPSIVQLNPSLPAHIEWVLSRMLAKYPSERFPNAREFVKALENEGAGAAPVVPVGAPQTVQRGGTTVMPAGEQSPPAYVPPPMYPVPTAQAWQQQPQQPQQPQAGWAQMGEPIGQTATPPKKKRRLGIVLIPILLVIVAVAAYFAIQYFVLQNPERLVSKAEDFMASGEYDDAAESYEKALDRSPDDVEVMTQLGWAYYYQQNYTAAYDTFSETLRLEPLAEDALEGLARTYEAEGKADQAIAVAVKMLDHGYGNKAAPVLESLGENGNADALLLLSAHYASTGQTNKLEEINEKVGSLIPEKQAVNLENRVLFLGYDLQTLPENQIEVSLYFEALDDLPAGYSLFMHGVPATPALLPEDRQESGFLNFDHALETPSVEWVRGAIYRDKSVQEIVPGVFRFRFGFWHVDSRTYLMREDDPENRTINLDWKFLFPETADQDQHVVWGVKMYEMGNFEAALNALDPLQNTGRLDVLLPLSSIYADMNDARRQDINAQIAAQIQQPMEVNLDGLVKVMGATVYYDQDAGETHIEFYFECLADLDKDYVLWIHAHPRNPELLPEAFAEVGYQNLDMSPAPPTSEWKVGAVVQIHKVTPNLAPGEWQFKFGIWDTVSKERLKVIGTDAGSVELDWVSIP